MIAGNYYVVLNPFIRKLILGTATINRQFLTRCFKGLNHNNITSQRFEVDHFDLIQKKLHIPRSTFLTANHVSTGQEEGVHGVVHTYTAG